MPPLKVDSVTTSYRQSDVHDSWVYSRQHKALLASTGHLFRDGRWIGEDDHFHVYIEYDPPCLGQSFPFTFPSYEARGEGDFPGTPVNGTFRTCVTRAYDSSTYYGSVANVPLPDPKEPLFSDYVSDLNSQGTSWIKANRPGNPTASVFQFIGELRDLPRIPIIHHTRLKGFRDEASALGDEFLNIEFGWKPFVQDLKKMYKTQRTLEARLQWLRDHNGVPVRGRRKPQVTTTTTVLAEGSLSSPWGHLGDVSKGGSELLEGFYVGGPTGCADLDLYSFVGQCDYKLTKQTNITFWNTGTFRYFVPEIGSSQWTERAKSALFGLDPNPSSLWELIPWSWLIDWFSNVGDIVSNYTRNAVDNETLTNSYSMRTISERTIVDISNHWDHHSSAPFGVLFDVPAGSDSLSYLHSETQKLRQQSSPYGFGLSWPDFTSRQVTILAALGIIREKPLRKTLKAPFS